MVTRRPNRSRVGHIPALAPLPGVGLSDLVGFAGLLALVVASAIVAKTLTSRTNTPALAAVDSAGPGVALALEPPVAPTGRPHVGPGPVLSIADPLSPPAGREQPGASASAPASAAPGRAPSVVAQPKSPADGHTYHDDLSIRYFNGRPVRPKGTVWMTVTAYSPDHRSCGDSADGITASLHHVHTHAHRLVAADTRLLPMGSMLSIPGYDAGRIVPVLDRGGAIKGHRLDVLFPTHERARAWGVRRLKVTVWEYADAKPKTNWRKIRDARP